MSINTTTQINNSDNPPIEAVFGLHCQRFGTLPSLSQWCQINSYVQSYSPIKLLTVDILSELNILAEHPDCTLVVRVPTLGFTDPAFDYDVRPWFLTPVAINGYIAQTGTLEQCKVAQLWASDIAQNHFKLLFNQQGLLDYDKMSELAQSDVIFTTLQNIDYAYSLPTLLGEGLEKLPEKEWQIYQNAICFFPPPMAAEKYKIELILLNRKQEVIQKRSISLSSVSQSHLFVSHFETLHTHSTQPKSHDYLSIKAGMYVEQELPLSRYGYKIKILGQAKINLGRLFAYTQPVPYHFRPGLDYIKTKHIAQKQPDLYEYVLFFGLSFSAIKQLIQIVVSKDKFFKNHLISSVQQSSRTQNQYNNYYQHPDLLDKLYDLVTEACAHKTIPIYALSESFELSAIIFSKLMNLDTSQWDRHDQWVFERMIYEQLPNIYKNYDPMEVGFEWVDTIDRLLNEHPTDIDIQNNIDIVSGKLSAQQLIEIEIYLDDFDKSAFEKLEENTPSLILSKTLESTEFNQRYGKNSVIKNSLSL